MSQAVYDRDGVKIFQGDALSVLRELPEESVNTCVTSPPYWGLRDYGVEGQIGLERTPEEYVSKMVEVFREVRRVMKSDGTLWLNLGDCYATGAGKVGDCPGGGQQGDNWTGPTTQPNRMPIAGLKPKDLVGIPWRVAFALQADGWWLRSDIIWNKPNCLVESVQDRCTKSHEHIFMLAKSERYYFDRDAIAEPIKEESISRYDYAFGGNKNKQLVEANKDGVGQRTRIVGNRSLPQGKHSTADPQSAGRRITESVAAARANGADHDNPFGHTRNKRSVWTVITRGYPGAHFATFPPALIDPCIKAGCPEGGVVLDPFLGSGTTAQVALANNCSCWGIELNPAYIQLAIKRFKQRRLKMGAQP